MATIKNTQDFVTLLCRYGLMVKFKDINVKVPSCFITTDTNKFDEMHNHDIIV